MKADAELAAAHPQEKEGFCGITIKGVTYDEKKTAGERLLLACSELPNSEEKVIGSYRGFELSLRFDTYHSEYQALLKGQRKYSVALGKDPLGCIIRLDNSLNNFPERITSAENELATLKQQQEAAQIEVEKPFPQEEELAEKSARLAELNAQLDMDEKGHEPEQDEEEQEDEPRRPSVLAALEEKADKTETVKPFKSFLDKDGDNHSQKLLSFRYNIDTNRVEARFTDGSAVANRMPNCLRTSSTRYFTVGLTRRIECHRFFMATAENHCNVFCVTNWSSE